MILNIALAVLRILIGLLLLLGAYGKYKQPYATALRDVRAYRIAGPRVSGAVVIILPVVEGLFAACLIAGIGIPATGFLAAALFLGFAGVAVSAVARGIVTDCGCFGSVLRQRVGVPLVIRNLLFAAILIADAIATPHMLVLPQAGPVEVLIGSCIAAALAIGSGLSRRTEYRRETTQS